MDHYNNLSLEDFQNENWLPINGYDGVYNISNLGRIKILKRVYYRYQKLMGTVAIPVKEKILKQSLTSRGYCFVFLAKKAGEVKRRSFLVHRLVAETFLGKSDLTVNHIDAKKTNNCVENLEWMTMRENVQAAYKMGIHKNTRIKKFGKDNHISKSIIQFDLNGNEISRFNSIADACRLLNGYPSGISGVCSGKVNYNTAYGYKWAFANK